MTLAPTETVILCEGYHDRAFWAGFLEDAGFQDARPKRAGGSRGTAIDPFGKPVASGDFAFLSNAGEFVRVRPCHGAPKVIERMKDRLTQRKTAGLEHLIINLDTDASDEGNDSIAREDLSRAIRDRIRQIAEDFVEEPDGDVLLDQGATRISGVYWRRLFPAGVAPWRTCA